MSVALRAFQFCQDGKPKAALDLPPAQNGRATQFDQNCSEHGEEERARNAKTEDLPSFRRY